MCVCVLLCESKKILQERLVEEKNSTELEQLSAILQQNRVFPVKSKAHSFFWGQNYIYFVMMKHVMLKCSDSKPSQDIKPHKFLPVYYQCNQPGYRPSAGNCIPGKA